jgi:hypothetical protein
MPDMHTYSSEKPPGTNLSDRGLSAWRIGQESVGDYTRCGRLFSENCCLAIAAGLLCQICSWRKSCSAWSSLLFR